MATAKSWIEINKSILKNKDIKWFGHKGIFIIDKQRMAEIELDGGSTTSWFYYRVKIVNRINGNCISANLFWFRDWCEKAQSSRTDHNGILHIFVSDINRDEPRWYIHEPKNTKALEEAIFEYINLVK